MAQLWDVGEIRRLGSKPTAYVFIEPLSGVRLSLFSLIVIHEEKIAFEGTITYQGKKEDM